MTIDEAIKQLCETLNLSFFEPLAKPPERVGDDWLVRTSMGVGTVRLMKDGLAVSSNWKPL